MGYSSWHARTKDLLLLFARTTRISAIYLAQLFALTMNELNWMVVEGVISYSFAHTRQVCIGDSVAVATIKCFFLFLSADNGWITSEIILDSANANLLLA